MPTTSLKEAVDAGDVPLAESFEALDDVQKRTLLRVVLGAAGDDVLGEAITGLDWEAVRKLVRTAIDRSDEALLRRAVEELDGEDTRKTFAAVASGLRTAKRNETAEAARRRVDDAVAALDAETRRALQGLGPLRLLDAATTAMLKDSKPDVRRLGREADDVLRRLKSVLA
jgi:hypothetical protein